jgi:Fic family protein
MALEFYTLPSAMTPFFPEHKLWELRELASELIKRSAELKGLLNPYSRKAIARLVEPMNSYYSNLIEGHFTHPLDIESALKKNYSKDHDKKILQLESKAHIEAHKQIKAKLSENKVNVCSKEFICLIHQLFYESLPDDFKKIKSKTYSPGDTLSNDGNGLDLRVVHELQGGAVDTSRGGKVDDGRKFT